MIELNSLLLPQLLYEIAVKLLLVSGILQGIPDQVDLVHVQLYVVSAADHGKDRNRFVRFGSGSGSGQDGRFRIKLL